MKIASKRVDDCGSSHVRVTPYLGVKRVLDIVGALLVLLVFSWLLILLALLVLIFEGRPIIFRQMRTGRGGKLFALYKFRTMRPLREGESVSAVTDGMRVTPFGRLLRRSSLDELPEFFNIVRGDMSFVGPRPLLPEYLSLYTEEQNHRHDLRPGLTGLAQVSGRNILSWDERFAFDLFYVRHISFALDAAVLFRTVGVVLSRKNLDVISEPFTGSSHTSQKSSSSVS